MADVPGRAALTDAAVKQPLGQRRYHEQGDAPAAGGFAEDGHAARVPAEGGDVFLDPLQGLDLVHEAVVARGLALRLPGEPGVGKGAEEVEAVIDGDQDHAPLDQLFAGVAGVGA
jgi:hypothetical protein